MILTYEQIKEAITKPKNRQTLAKARVQQDRIKFHACTQVVPTLNQPLTDFLSMVGKLLPADKFRMFKLMFRFPVRTNRTAGTIFDKLSRVFDGRNAAFNYQFVNQAEREDWESYRKDVLNEPKVWATKGWEYFKTEINSVLVVDMPTEPSESDRYARPYFYWLTVDNIISYEANPITGQMEFIAFKQPGDKVAIIDDAYYRVYQTKGGVIEGMPIVEVAHDLGYTPARFFWNEPLSITTPDIKKSPLSVELEALDWFLFFHLSKRNLDLYGAYPIYSGYEMECDFHNDETGEYCDGGFLKDKQNNYMYDANGLLMRCPKCGDKRIAGVGSFVEIPIPGTNAGGEEQPDLRNPVQMLTVDRSSLDYNTEETKRLETEIVQACVGTDSEGLINTQALNEAQVNANFESQTTILNTIKKGFEDAQKWVDSTICRLRYGKGFLGASVSYGTEFYNLSANDLRKRYKEAKDSGASDAELDAMQTQILETEYRNNPAELQRMLILRELEPYPHLTLDEVQTYHEKGIISDRDLVVKLNFSNFVRRFERENTNLLDFGNAIEFNKKIEIINNKFSEYGTDTSIRQRNSG
nr:MAG TPA: portal [Caudoviricetes sp.]